MRHLYELDSDSEEERDSDEYSEEDSECDEFGFRIFDRKPSCRQCEIRDKMQSQDTESDESETDQDTEGDKSRQKLLQDDSDTESMQDELCPKDTEERSDTDFRTQILMTLKELEGPSAFAFSAVQSSLPNPCLYLPQHGVLGLPLSSSDAQKIISEASQSPFGKGEKTLIDTTVRKSYELSPKQFELKNPKWKEALKTILDDVKFGLGIKKGTGKISAELNKLIIYEPGAFFKAHKDSEKGPGMFATLVVCLPSPHKGGKLVMTHDNENYEFDTEASSNFEFSYAAWYADITHEVTPVTAGYRLVLTYNLIREISLEIPQYELALEHAAELSTLLEEYSLQLQQKDAEDDELPPMLLHKLKHKYTQTNLQLKLLKPRDFGHVQTLAQISSKLGFNIYLAFLELVVNTCDEGMLDEVKNQTIENMVELDGKFVVKHFSFPKSALIDPSPQDKGKPYKEDHEGPTGNEGSPATYWYHDAVVVLVPPSKQLDFVFKFGYKGKLIRPMFNKLMQEYAEDPSQKPKLEQLCELAVKQKPRNMYTFKKEPANSLPPFFEKALTTALDIGRIDLLGEACKSRGDEILIEHAHTLGRFTANNGISTASEKLIKCLQGASSIATMVEFLKLVAEGFKEIVPESNSKERISLEGWLKEAIFTAVVERATFTKADGKSLANLCKTMDWNLFESGVKQIILNAAIVVKIAFIDELMSILQQKLNEQQSSFIEMITHSIWEKFVFNFIDGRSVLCSDKNSTKKRLELYSNKDSHNEDDMLHIVKTTITILSPKCVETTIIPALLSAIPNASNKCAIELFIPLVKHILKNELAGFKLPAITAVPPSSHKHLVQALLMKFLMEKVGPEPQAPSLSFSPGSCNCSDCSMVNQFLQDPLRQSFEIKCLRHRREHLTSTFIAFVTLDKVNISRCGKIWKIEKCLFNYNCAKSRHKAETETAIRTLKNLKTDEPMMGRLETYLQPYHDIIMNADVKKLPDLQSWVTTLLPVSEKDSTSHQTGHKRGTSETGLPAKQTC